MADLKLTDVEKVYGGTVRVLSDINLDIKTGELIVFVGPSGCGKSTLLRMIAGLEKITGGTLEIDGQVVNDVPPSQRGIAMVFQSYALYPHMTVYENMAFSLRIAKVDAATIDAKVRAAAEDLLAETEKAMRAEFERKTLAATRQVLATVAPWSRAAVETETEIAANQAKRDALQQALDALRRDVQSL